MMMHVGCARLRSRQPRAASRELAGGARDEARSDGMMDMSAAARGVGKMHMCVACGCWMCVQCACLCV